MGVDVVLGLLEAGFCLYSLAFEFMLSLFEGGAWYWSLELNLSLAYWV